jgi:hypothetical protein
MDITTFRAVGYGIIILFWLCYLLYRETKQRWAIKSLQKRIRLLETFCFGKLEYDGKNWVLFDVKDVMKDISSEAGITERRTGIKIKIEDKDIPTGAYDMTR